jgi:hypothetical protein
MPTPLNDSNRGVSASILSSVLLYFLFSPGLSANGHLKKLLDSGGGLLFL